MASRQIRVQEIAFAALTVLLLVVTYTPLSGPFEGVHIARLDGKSHFIAGSSPLDLAVSGVTLAAYVWNLLTPVRAGGAAPPAPVIRRVLAFFIDLIWAIVLLAPWSGLAALWVEAGVTGKFEWFVERDVARSSDETVATANIAATFVLMFLYFAVSNYAAGGTPGYRTLGIRIEYLGAKPSLLRAARRTLVALSNLPFWIVTLPLAARDPEKRFWYDKAGKTRVVIAD